MEIKRGENEALALALAVAMETPFKNLHMYPYRHVHTRRRKFRAFDATADARHISHASFARRLSCTRARRLNHGRSFVSPSRNKRGDVDDHDSGSPGSLVNRLQLSRVALACPVFTRNRGSAARFPHESRSMRVRSRSIKVPKSIFHATRVRPTLLQWRVK